MRKIHPLTTLFLGLLMGAGIVFWRYADVLPPNPFMSLFRQPAVEAAEPAKALPVPKTPVAEVKTPVAVAKDATVTISGNPFKNLGKQTIFIGDAADAKTLGELPSYTVREPTEVYIRRPDEFPWMDITPSPHKVMSPEEFNKHFPTVPYDPANG